RGPNALDNNQGWRMVQTPTVGFSDTTFFQINVPRNTLSGPFIFSTAPSAAKAIFYVIVTGTVNIVTPVKLSFFKASYFGEGASIFWNVENEINFKEYVIERSFDGVNFDIYDRVPAKNSKSYEFKVAKLLAGKNYFRLKMIDKDGKFEYSKVELLESRTIKSNFNILPNPVATSLNFNWTEDGIYRFQLLGIDGKQFKLGPVLKGMNTIDVSSLNSGTYVLDVINAKGEVIAAKKVYKQ
ncbi:MAG: T9SS type A sorting domain-containing protein, partial [Chitinophagaceae bacterium]